MGLLNPRNFFSPFTNKVHLTTILLAGLIVGVLRFSLGRISLQDTSQVERRPAHTREVPVMSRRSESRLENSGSLTEEATTSLGAPQEVTPVPTALPRAQTEEYAPTLADIEKELGLR